MMYAVLSEAFFHKASCVKVGEVYKWCVCKYLMYVNRMFTNYHHILHLYSILKREITSSEYIIFGQNI